MPRADEGLAFLLKYENVAWYENGTVRILDRRCYPHPVSFVTCRTSAEVAQAITDMVTQSAGPYLAAGMGMVLAARGKDGTEFPWNEQNTKNEDGCFYANFKPDRGNYVMDGNLITSRVGSVSHGRCRNHRRHLP